MIADLMINNQKLRVVLFILFYYRIFIYIYIYLYIYIYIYIYIDR